MNTDEMSISDTHELKQITNNYLSMRPPLPKYLILSDILSRMNIDNWMIPSEKKKIARWINTISLLRWLCQDLAIILRFFCNSAQGYILAIFIFRLLEVNLFDQINKSQSIRQLYQRIMRIKSRPYIMSFSLSSPPQKNNSQQIDQNLQIYQYLSILQQQRQKSKNAIEPLGDIGDIEDEFFKFVSINNIIIAKDILKSWSYQMQTISFTNMGKGLNIIASNLALNLRRELRKEQFMTKMSCEECRIKIQFRLYLLSALILPHSLKQIQQNNCSDPKKRSPLLYFNQPSGIVQLHLYLLEEEPREINYWKRSLSDLISTKNN